LREGGRRRGVLFIFSIDSEKKGKRGKRPTVPKPDLSFAALARKAKKKKRGGESGFLHLTPKKRKERRGAQMTRSLTAPNRLAAQEERKGVEGNRTSSSSVSLDLPPGKRG